MLTSVLITYVYFKYIQVFSHMTKPENITGSADIMLFRDGIKPMWEDIQNRSGGKFTLRMKKAGVAAIWEETLLAIIGEQLEGNEDVCGAVLSIRYHDDNLSVWHKTADNEEVIEKLK